MSFLSSAEATNKVSSGTAYLTQATLDSFKQQVAVYDQYVIQIKATQSAPLNQAGMTMGFCVSQADRGVSCGTAKTGSGTSASDFRTYWFPTSYKVIDKIKANIPMDIWDATHDSYKIGTYFYGLDQYKLDMASSSALVGRKFQYKAVSDSAMWNNVKDYRFKGGDTISVYRMAQAANSGTITWVYDENRTLNSALPISLVGMALASLTAALVF